MEIDLLRCLWQPQQLNWWIGSIFALGSLLFLIGSWLSLDPMLVKHLSMSNTAVNRVFFLGSIPFTTAAYLQLFQAANAGPPLSGTDTSRKRIHWFGWEPQEIGWLSCALQFPGTILFNVNTLNDLNANLNWIGQDGLVWIPNLLGSILFLSSGYLAFIETCHSHWTWNPGSLSWWVTFSNLLGCVGFMGAALTSPVLPGGLGPILPTTSLIFTLLGAVGFLIGSLLMLPEAVTPS
ncbi:hypothetical protein [Synechococcus sp. RedBA-s]|uniref:hypothetical protein n=1 Tax=Synechococcus sp. RedBA-s TaxID=2823741 RepID=UPI0020CB81BC|nr:hypothetical protein [Synechococcus sp. RedBA-s]MCP9801769.1 hypothetical protein [Synechococcus sp. RedBA-s]